MPSIHTATSHVGQDGILNLILQMPPELTNQDVQVTVRAAKKPFASREEYAKFLAEIKGAWQGDFERPEQGQAEVRDSFD